MAENASWLQHHQGKVALWAHNWHISIEHDATGTTMGAHLRKLYQTGYRPLGFSFYQGSFNSIYYGADRDPKDHTIRTFTVGAPVKESYNSTLGSIGLPLYLLDLRKAQGAVRQWMNGPAPFRLNGMGYDPAQFDAAYTRGSLAQWFDLLIHVQNSTPSTYLGNCAATTQCETMQGSSRFGFSPACVRYMRRKRPVTLSAQRVTASGAPSAMMCPPLAPPSGPISNTPSAVFTTSILWSITITVLPASTSR